MVQKAIRKKRIDKDDIEARIKKILAAKLWLGLDQRKPVNTQQLYADLHRPESEKLIQTLADHAITLLINEAPLLDLNPALKTAILSVGVQQPSLFQLEVNEAYSKGMNFIIPAQATAQELDNVRDELSGYDQILLSLHDPRPRPGSNLPYNMAVKSFISSLSSRSIVCLFANPYTLLGLPGIENSQAVVVAYQNDEALQKAGAKVILQKVKAKGKLPVTINPFFNYGDGL